MPPPSSALIPNLRAPWGGLGPSGMGYLDRPPTSGPNIGYYPPGANPMTGAPGNMAAIPPSSPYAPGNPNNFNYASPTGAAIGAAGGLTNQYGTGSYNPDSGQWNTGGPNSVSTGPGVSTGATPGSLGGAGGAVATAGPPPGTGVDNAIDPQTALEMLMQAYGERTGEDPFNTGSVSSDWADILQAFPQLGQFIDTEALLREDLGAGDYLQPMMGAFSNDPLHLPGASRGLNWLLNLQMANVGRQVGRSNEAENLLRQMAGNAQWSSQNVGNEMLAGGARDLVAPGALDSLENAMRSQASEDIARSRMASEQAMRDAGFFGQGGAGADPLAALHRGAGDSLARANREITGEIEAMRGQRLGQASDALGTSTDIYRALNQDPQRQLAALLMGPKNFEEQNFYDLLGQAGSAEMANQVRRDSQGGIEGFITSLLSPAVGAISGGVGNAISNKLFG